MELDLEMRKQLRLLYKSNGFMNHNGMSVVSYEKDHAIFTMEIVPEACNPHGQAHGGALYGLADNAAATAVHTDGRLHVTQSSNMYFLRSRTSGKIFAEAKIVHRGKTVSLIEVIITDEDGVHLATGNFSFYCIGPNNSDASHIKL